MGIHFNTLSKVLYTHKVFKMVFLKNTILFVLLVTGVTFSYEFEDVDDMVMDEDAQDQNLPNSEVRFCKCSSPFSLFTIISLLKMCYISNNIFIIMIHHPKGDVTYYNHIYSS